MSFSNDVKDWLLNQKVEADCCMQSCLCAFINCLGSLEISKGGVTFSLKTDTPEILERVQEIINKLYSDKIEDLLVTSQTVGKVVLYEFTAPVNVGTRILKDCSIIEFDDKNMININRSIDHHVIMEDCCKIWYIKTCFLAVGSISVAQSGYHFELEFASNEQAKAVSNLLGEFGFITRKVERGEKFVVYMKEAESIADFLAFIGDTKSYLKLQEEIVNRDIRNSINRTSNCISANIAKTVDASVVQLNAISTIEETIGLDNLSNGLKEVAILRKNNPQASLSELINKSETPLTKSGLNYKLNKIVEISKNL